MERKVLVVCSVVGLLGLLSAVTGFVAEAKRIKLDHVQNPSPSLCEYPSSPASGLGFTAAFALLIAQIIISVVTGCFCCRRGPHLSNCKCAIAVVCFIFSWIASVIALFFLLAAAAFNVQRRDENAYFLNGNCYVVGAGVFSIGAALSLASVILGMFSYLVSNSEKNINDPWSQPPSVPINQGGIAIGQPRVVPPPQNAQDPVFV